MMRAPVPPRFMAIVAMTAFGCLSAAPGRTQETAHAGHDSMDHSTTGTNQPGPPPFSEGSGTSRVPGTEEPMQGLHLTTGSWMLMAHGEVAAQYTDVSGPRGDDKLYSTSMVMLTGMRTSDWGRIELKSMFSLEPLMSDRGYPSLFSTGETAGGEALVDRQHPHDFVMELAARIDWTIGTGTTAFVYGGPVGEPALGPSSFMHRGSAAHNPEPPIAHHWFDSTHITYGVITAGLSAPRWQLEASAFRGEEPDERRWNIEQSRFDSWSVRTTYNPSQSWALQASYGELDQPETLHPGQDERRFTASAHYSIPRLAITTAFSAKNRVPGPTLTAWLAELNWDFRKHDSLFGRIENGANDELFPDHDDPLHDQAFRVTRFQLGYAREVPLNSRFSLTVGASGSVYAKPGALDAIYGNDPFGYTLFARFRLGR
jgi:hypothetical protein